MERDLRSDCLNIGLYSVDKNMPQRATEEHLKTMDLGERITCLAIGKAAWHMAQGALKVLGDRIVQGAIITKTGHARGELTPFTNMEAGHPLPDSRSLEAGAFALEMADSLREGDHLLVLLSGGGSSLLESPLDGISLEDLTSINRELLESGASIEEINVVRKRLSRVKAGRLALTAHPARITTLILSDVVGNDLEAVASGPTLPDRTTREQAYRIIQDYGLKLTDPMKEAMDRETPKAPLSQALSIGDVTLLCSAAKERAIALGYRATVLTSSLRCEAKEAGSFLASIARDNVGKGPKALILGGETVVHVRGKGLGGRNQELALAAAIGIGGLDGVTVMSMGSDGTDGPTDGAGGIVDGQSYHRMKRAGIDPVRSLEDNDSYHALKASGDLLRIGPTGTNVNDLIVLLWR